MPAADVEQGKTAAEQFLIRWRGEPNEREAKALDVYWVSATEHGMNASTFTARIAASTGADCAACLAAAVGTLSGPLHGGAPARVLPMLDAVAESGDPERYVEDLLARGERIMGFGHRVYRAEDPRARVLRRTAKELGSPRVEVAEALETAAIAALREKHPDRPLETNVEFWGAVVLEIARVPAAITPALFACARTGGWSAHIVEQKRDRAADPAERGLRRPARATPVGAVDGSARPGARAARVWQRRGPRASFPHDAEIFDAHVHLGDDIDGMRGRPEELLGDDGRLRRRPRVHVLPRRARPAPGLPRAERPDARVRRGVRAAASSRSCAST